MDRNVFDTLKLTSNEELEDIQETVRNKSMFQPSRHLRLTTLVQMLKYQKAIHPMMMPIRKVLHIMEMRFSRGKDGGKWTNCHPVQARVSQCNVLCGPLQNVVHVNHITPVDEMFKLYITKNMIDIIVDCANVERLRKMAQNPKIV